MRKDKVGAEELGSEYNKAFAYRQIGHIHWDKGEFRQAMEWMKKSRAISEKTREMRRCIS